MWKCRGVPKTRGKSRVLVVGNLFILLLLSACLCHSLLSWTRKLFILDFGNTVFATFCAPRVETPWPLSWTQVSLFLQGKKLAWLLLTKTFANPPDCVSWWSCRRQNLLFLHGPLWIPMWMLIIVSGSVSWNSPWCVKKNVSLSYLCAPEHHRKDPQLNLSMRKLKIENSDNLLF